VKTIIGLVVNAAAFLLIGIGLLYVAVPLYVASVVILLWPKRRQVEEKKEVVRELTPDEIKRRPVSAPEV